MKHKPAEEGNRIGKYLGEARIRARRRKSPWNFLLIPAVLGPLAFFWIGSTHVLIGIYRARHPLEVYRLLPDTPAGVVMALAPFFAWLAPSMVLGNCLVWLIPPARNVLAHEALGYQGTDFRSAQRKLLL